MLAFHGVTKITAGCATLKPWAAMVVASIAGTSYPFCSDLLVWLKIDDVVDATPVHLVCGIWGVLAVGFFSEPSLVTKVTGISGHPGLFYSLSEGHTDASLLACQTVGVVFILGWTAATMLPFFLGVHKLDLFRAQAVEEIVGLDMVFTDKDNTMDDDEREEIGRDEYVSAYEEFKRRQLEQRKAGRAGFSLAEKFSHKSQGSGTNTMHVDI